MWFKIKENIVEMRIIAKPNAKTSKLLAVTEQGLHIAVHATPHQGEANKELIAFLAKTFSVPKSKIILEKGSTSRYKRVCLPLNEKIQKFLVHSEQL